MSSPDLEETLTSSAFAKIILKGELYNISGEGQVTLTPIGDIERLSGTIEDPLGGMTIFQQALRNFLKIHADENFSIRAMPLTTLDILQKSLTSYINKSDDERVKFVAGLVAESDVETGMK